MDWVEGEKANVLHSSHIASGGKKSRRLWNGKLFFFLDRRLEEFMKKVRGASFAELSILYYTSKRYFSTKTKHSNLVIGGTEASPFEFEARRRSRSAILPSFENTICWRVRSGYNSIYEMAYTLFTIPLLHGVKSIFKIDHSKKKLKNGSAVILHLNWASQYSTFAGVLLLISLKYAGSESAGSKKCHLFKTS